jgi:hypothetical protein
MLNARQLDALNNAHPFQCEGEGCSNCYTTARYAARCCKVSCVDLRDGTATVYSEEAELTARAEDEARWAEERKAYRYECSCGECYRTVEGARGCRKCRVYTEEGYCTEVTDLNALEGPKVVWRLNPHPAPMGR